MAARIDNRLARRAFLDAHGLAEQPAGPARGDDLRQVITRLGFVQVDSIATVARAHHMILFARRPAYREPHLDRLYERDRALFEHWTHDAAVIPVEFYPHWRLKQSRDAQKLRRQWRDGRREGFEKQVQAVLDRIDAYGPVSSADVGEGEARGSGGWWDWHPSKTALEYLWRSGALAVTRRDNFRKVYDRAERVIPQEHRQHEPDPGITIDWLCNGAIDRLGFATSGEIAAFWDIVTPDEARRWCERACATGALEESEIACADGRLRRCLARPGLRDRALAAPEPPGRVRVLSPFDPALRDRKRAERLFGFHYRIEIFTPEPKRQFGYYVFPLLEGDRIVGRADMKADRREGVLNVTALWPEPGMRWGTGRQDRFEAELTRLCRFAGLQRVVFADGFLRDHPG